MFPAKPVHLSSAGGGWYWGLRLVETTRSGIISLVRPAPESPVGRAQVSSVEEARQRSITRAQAPTLSFACRLGWNLNNKETWTQAAEFEHDKYFTSRETSNNRALEQVQPALLGTVSFTRASEKDIEDFRSRFLGGA